MSRATIWLAVIGGACASAVAAAPGPEPANAIILTEGSNRGMTVGLRSDLRESFTPGAHDAAAVAEMFKSLCLDTRFDPAALRAAAERAGFMARAITLGGGKQPGFTLTSYMLPSARVSIYDGSDAGLKQQPVAIRDRGVTVASGYGPYKATGRQCNLDLRAGGLGPIEPFVTRLNAHLGASPTKRVSKPGYADGQWSWGGAGAPATVAFAVVGLNKANQLIHVVLREVTAAK